ncbi:ABC transporter substrate-binding protein [Oceanomicrobium pacificus]|uniref:ABC transporter substrate-binding protein n=1 Tax=Oceanomicrobium pacificus TaxID=2692916 RepID=A0A6B0TTD4_9RHOB|nr:ABC transporter substrate-binding protein [Oceanomicrobium pacificus]MXU66039.1 ABC transporter substrate-binding protein [Oceanomicrobium pacificus]
MLKRRTVLKSMAAGLGAGIVAGPLGLGVGRALADGHAPLTINVPGNTLGVHVPYMAAINEGLVELGEPAAKWERVPKLQTITQSILSGQTEVGAGDAISTLRAVEAGADLKIIGNAFMHTSLVFVVNADKISEPKDLEKDDVTIAVNSKGDFTHVMVVGPMTAKGVDMDKVNVIKMGGSGNRFRALLAGKVDGVPLHFDQAAELASQGNFKVLIEPAKEYEAFLGEVWIVSGGWLEKPENRDRAKALLKATTIAFRQANDDPAWYADMYRKHGTKENMATATDEEIEVVRQALGVDIGCWPNDMHHELAVYEQLLPVYKAAGAIKGTVDLTQVVDTSLIDEVLADIG